MVNSTSVLRLDIWILFTVSGTWLMSRSQAQKATFIDRRIRNSRPVQNLFDLAHLWYSTYLGSLPVSWLISRCFEPSQPQRIISGLKTNLNPSAIILLPSHKTNNNKNLFYHNNSLLKYSHKDFFNTPHTLQNTQFWFCCCCCFLFLTTPKLRPHTILNPLR